MDDGHVAATFGAVEAALAAASPIVARLVMPMPTWHGHAQRFYRLRDTAEYTAPSTWSCSSGPTPAATTTSPSATAARWSCSTGPGSSARPLDQAELAATLARAVAGIRERLPFTLPLVAKEVRRGDALAALGSWHRHVLAPLVKLYRVRHAPARHDFGTRYTRDDLPAEVQETLAELSFVADLDDLAAKLPQPSGCWASCSTSWAQNGNGRCRSAPSPT